MNAPQAAEAFRDKEKEGFSSHPFFWFDPARPRAIVDLVSTGPQMKELGFLLLGFLLVAGPSLVAYIKLWERFSWLQRRFNEHQEKLRNIGSYVVDANERLWGAGILQEEEEKLKKIGLSHSNEGARVQPDYRKWDL